MNIDEIFEQITSPTCPTLAINSTNSLQVYPQNNKMLRLFKEFQL